MQALQWLIIALVLLLIALSFALLQKLNSLSKKSDGDAGGEVKDRLGALNSRLADLSRQNADEFERSRRENAVFQKEIRDETTDKLLSITTAFNEMKLANTRFQQELGEKVSQSLKSIYTANAQQNERQARQVAESVARLQESNEKKLDQMRATVDEKLSETLTERLGSSFKAVSDRLESVNKSLGEMKELSSGVTDNVTSLNRVLSNVKVRGSWADVQLENILDQTITHMYENSFTTNPKVSERVEFAVKIPGGGDSKQITYLPIDSKLPMEDYIRLCAAADAADPQALQTARRALEATVLNEAKKVTKYINVPYTTPFAIMYLATEGLYSEIAGSRAGLPERLHSQLNVMVAGPSTVPALLNSLSMGFRAVAINDKANEVRELLEVTKAQYENFGTLLSKARKKIDEAGASIDRAQKRSDIIQGKLSDVDAIDYGRAEELLGSADSSPPHDEGSD